jgi:hypothetical protein
VCAIPTRASDDGAGPVLIAIPPQGVYLDSGRLEQDETGAMVLRDAVVRGTAPGSDGQAARLEFTYLGPSKEAAPLASGELRRQVGLKLRARDGCNVLYVMWRLAPASGLHVQVKFNPGLSLHRECRDGGYATVAPQWQGAVPTVAAGQRHSLEARVDGRSLRVGVDGALAWEGRLPDEVLSMEGPAGLRTDNGQFQIVLWASSRAGPGGQP